MLLDSQFKDLNTRVVVVKVGGDLLSSDAMVESLAKDLLHIQTLGTRAIVVHGGGSEIDEHLRAAGIQPAKIDGLRVTDGDTIKVVVSVLDGINQKLASQFEQLGASSEAFPSTRKLFQGKRLTASSSNGRPIDLGFVGDVTGVNATDLFTALDQGRIAVVAPIARGIEGLPLNVNADSAAVQLAICLQASMLLFLSDVPGVLSCCSNPDSLLPQVDLEACRQLLNGKSITGGMRPKLHAAMQAIPAGVESVFIADGRKPGVIFDALTARKNAGTAIIA